MLQQLLLLFFLLVFEFKKEKEIKMLGQKWKIVDGVQEKENKVSFLQ